MARYFKDILRLFICGDFQGEKVICFVYAYCSLGSSDILASPSYAFLSLILVVFALLSVALGLGDLFIQYEYDNLCGPLSVTLCTLAPFLC